MDERTIDSKRYQDLKFENECFEGYKIADSQFDNCQFNNCKLIGCSLTGCTFHGCSVINLKAEGFSRIQFAEFSDCRLIGINWNELLSSGAFAQPIGAVRNSCLKYNTFTEMNFKKFDFSGNEIQDSMFADCRLMESSFRACKLERTEFLKCNLQKSDFQEALGYQIDIMSCAMRDAAFSFPEAVRLLQVLHIRIE